MFSSLPRTALISLLTLALVAVASQVDFGKEGGEQVLAEVLYGGCNTNDQGIVPFKEGTTEIDFEKLKGKYGKILKGNRGDIKKQWPVALLNIYSSTAAASRIEALTDTHKKYVNCLFNEAIAKMQKNTEKWIDDKKCPPFKILKLNSEDIDGCKELKKNDKTYALATLAINDYEKYRNSMYAVKRMINADFKELDDPGLVAEGVFGSKETRSSTGVLKMISTINARIDEEIAYAKKALDLSLAAYDEMRSAYPWHYMLNGKENPDSLVRNLEKYRDNLADLRKQIEKLPGKFKDATTTSC